MSRSWKTCSMSKNKNMSYIHIFPHNLSSCRQSFVCSFCVYIWSQYKPIKSLADIEIKDGRSYREISLFISHHRSTDRDRPTDRPKQSYLRVAEGRMTSNFISVIIFDTCILFTVRHCVYRHRVKANPVEYGGDTHITYLKIWQNGEWKTETTYCTMPTLVLLL